MTCFPGPTCPSPTSSTVVPAVLAKRAAQREHVLLHTGMEAGHGELGGPRQGRGGAAKRTREEERLNAGERYGFPLLVPPEGLRERRQVPHGNIILWQGFELYGWRCCRGCTGPGVRGVATRLWTGPFPASIGSSRWPCFCILRWIYITIACLVGLLCGILQANSGRFLGVDQRPRRGERCLLLRDLRARHEQMVAARHAR
jgi:hypothetical protein